MRHVLAFAAYQGGAPKTGSPQANGRRVDRRASFGGSRIRKNSVPAHVDVGWPAFLFQVLDETQKLGRDWQDELRVVLERLMVE